MIEMIFAIVLIAIVVAAVPQIMTRNVQTIEGNRAQEAVFLASAAAKRLLSYRWDTNSKDTDIASDLDYAKVLDLDAAGSSRETATVGATTLTLPVRSGHIKQEKHRRFHSIITTPAGRYLENNVSLASLKGAAAFKFDYNLTVNAGFVSTFGVTTSPNNTLSNTKMAEIRMINNDTNNIDVLMRIYAFNIGEIDYAKRTF